MVNKSRESFALRDLQKLYGYERRFYEQHRRYSYDLKELLGHEEALEISAFFGFASDCALKHSPRGIYRSYLIPELARDIVSYDDKGDPTFLKDHPASLERLDQKFASPRCPDPARGFELTLISSPNSDKYLVYRIDETGKPRSDQGFVKSESVAEVYGKFFQRLF